MHDAAVEPSRWEPGWHPLAPAALVLELGGPLRRLATFNLPLLLIWAVSGEARLTGIYAAYSLVVFAVVVVHRVVATLLVRVRLEGDRLELREGFVWRRHRVLERGRIQNVEVRGSVVHELLGVLEVRVETASQSGDAEVRVPALPREDALALAHALRAAGGTATPTAPAAPLHALGILELLAHGATTLAPASTLLMAAALNEWGSLLARDLVRPVPDARQSIAILAFSFGASQMLALGRALLHTGGFRLVRTAAGRIRATRGWGWRRSTEVPVARLQALCVRESAPLRLLGYAHIQLETAAAPQRTDDGREVPVETEVPMVERPRVAALAGAILPGAAEALDAELQPAAPVASARRAVERAVGVLHLAALACWFLHSAHGLWLLLAAAVAGGVEGRFLRWGRTETHLVTRTGWWSRSTWVVPRARVQQVTLARDPLQRAVGTATVRVAFAGGAVGVRDVPVAQALALAGWLEQVEPRAIRSDAPSAP